MTHGLTFVTVMPCDVNGPKNMQHAVPVTAPLKPLSIVLLIFRCFIPRFCVRNQLKRVEAGALLPRMPRKLECPRDGNGKLVGG